MNISKSLLWSLFIGLLTLSCSDNEPIPDTFLYLKTNAYFGVENGNPFIFKVMRSNKYYDIEDLTDHCELFVDNELVKTNLFKPSHSGTFTVKAKYKNWTSEILKIEIRKVELYDSISIPIILHVFPNSLLSQQDASYIVENLNKGFNGELHKGYPNQIKSNIHFRLAVLDINGNTLTEPGIVRHSESLVTDMSINANKLMWNPNKYLNIFILESDGGQSYGMYPPSFTNIYDCFYSKEIVPGSSWRDTFDDDENYYFGSLLKSTDNYTIMHEIGHNLGLTHTHEGCQECAPKDVQQYNIEDKYIYKNRHFGFANCDEKDRYIIHDNTMDYNGSVEGFTYDQIKTMRYNLNHRPWIMNLKYSDR